MPVQKAHIAIDSMLKVSWNNCLYVEMLGDISRAWHQFLILIISIFIFLSTSAFAQGAKEITINEFFYKIQCKNPHSTLCVIMKPSPSNYIFLSKAIAFDDYISYWVADFSKEKYGNNSKLNFTVLSGNGELHTYEIQFIVNTQPHENQSKNSSSNGVAIEKNDAKPLEIKPSKKSVQEISSNVESIDAVNKNSICNLIQSSAVIKRYIEAAKNASLQGVDYILDTPDELIGKWAVDEIRKRSKEQVYQEMRNCFQSLKDENYIFLFAQTNENVKNIREQIASKKPIVSKVFDANGNLRETVTPNKTPIFLPELKVQFSDQYRRSGAGPAVALFLQGGINIIEKNAPPIISSIEDQTTARIQSAKIVAAREKADKEIDIANKKQEAQAKLEKENAQQAEQVAAKLKAEKEYKEKVSAVTKNPDIAKDCEELAMSDAYPDIYGNFSLDAKISADNKIYTFNGRLDSYSEDAVFGNGKGIISSARKYASIKISKKTKWFGKGDIKIGESKITGFGKYIANAKFNMTNGVSVQGPEFEMICIEELPSEARQLIELYNSMTGNKSK